MTGAAFDDIARELGYANRSGAWKAVQRCLTRRTNAAVDEDRRVPRSTWRSCRRRRGLPRCTATPVRSTGAFELWINGRGC